MELKSCHRKMICSTYELWSLLWKGRSYQLWNESQKEHLRSVPSSRLGLGRPVSRVEMNAKNAPLTPSFPNRRSPMLSLQPKGAKRALTKPTMSYMGHPDLATTTNGQRPSGGRGRNRAA